MKLGNYDAFMSYSHTDDYALAPILQTRLQQFAKPWYRMRALRVFRDAANLTASPRLWGSIEEALESSRWFILLASEGAAASDWVNREVAWWLENRSSDRLLVVATSRGVSWDRKVCDWSARSPVPPALRGAFDEVPLWVDLSHVPRDAKQLDDNLVAAVAAPIREKPKDALIGEHVREHRRVIRLALGAGISFIVLAVAAFQQHQNSERQRNLNVYNQTMAKALQLSTVNPTTAARLDLAAYRIRPTPEAATRLLNTENTPLSRLLINTESSALSFSPDGRTLAIGGGSVRMWNVSDPANIHRFSQPIPNGRSGVSALAFSPDSRILAIGGTGASVWLWDVADPAHPRKLGQALYVGKDGVDSLAFSRDGQLLAIDTANLSVQLWEVGDPLHPRELTLLKTSGASSVAFSPDSQLLATAGSATDSGNSDGIVRLWNVTDPSEPHEYNYPMTTSPGQTLSATFSPNGHILAAGAHGGAGWLWDISNPARPRQLSSFRTPGTGITTGSVAFSPDGDTLANCSRDGFVRLWDVTNPTHLEQFAQLPTDSTEGVAAAAFGPGGKLASIGRNGSTQLWNFPMTTLTGHTSAITALAFNSDGDLLATGGQQDALRLWNVTNPAHPRALGQPLEGVGGEAAAFSPTSHVMATGSYHGTVRLWDVKNPTRPRPLGSPIRFSGMIVSLAFSPDGRTLAINRSGVQLWNVSNPSHPYPFGPRLKGTIYSLEFSPNGRILATGGQISALGVSALQLWNVTDPAHPQKMGSAVSKWNEDTIDSVAFSPDGNTLASGSYNDRIRLWNVDDPALLRELANLKIRGGAINSVAFNPAGDKLATASSDGKVRLWDVADPQHLREFMQPLFISNYAVDTLTFNKSNGDLAVGDDYPITTLWNLSVGYAIDRICSDAKELSPAQWHKYIPQLPFQPTCAS